MRAGTPLAVEQTNNDLAAILADGSRSRRKNTPGDQSMRRSIQDLVLSIDPNVRIDADVEDVRRAPLSDSRGV
jgi:transcription initiation factor TFIID subunit 12